MILVETLSCFLALLTLVPVSMLFVQVLMALPGHRAKDIPQGRRPAVAVLVPAHDEALVIVDTLRTILPQLSEKDVLLVVADNCCDDTARLAAGAGATVIERCDLRKTGKIHALEFGIRHLAEKPPDVIVIVDADCQIHDGTIDRLARSCCAAGRPIQSQYLMLAPEGAPLGVQLAEFAWIVRNWVRPMGMRRLGLPCHLMGAGMAFPWGVMARFFVANAELAEDLKLGIDLSLAGHLPEFCPDAKVTSHFPEMSAAQQTQRTRWEHGSLQLILREVPRLLCQGALRRNVQLLGLAIDFMIPPLTLMGLILAASIALSLGCALLMGGILPLGISAAALGMFVASIALAWWEWGRKAVSLASLVSMPGYVLGKLPIYLRFLTRRQKIWVKTRRG